MVSYRTTIAVLNVAAVFSITWLPWTHVVAAVIFYMVAMPVTQLIFHEYISHVYIQPKNKVIEAICLWIFVVLGGRLSSKFSYHKAHHRHWLCADKDPTQQKINASNFWLYLLGLGRSVPQSFQQHRHPLLNTSGLANFFSSHCNIVQSVTVLTAAFVLPMEFFVILFVIYPWITLIVFSCHDWYYHGPCPGKDNSFWFLLFNNACWHRYHHENPQIIYFGPRKWKWFNLSWYVYRGLFRPA